MDKIIRKIYTPNVEVLLWPILTIIVTSILSVFVFRNGYAKITEKLGVLENTKAVENTLSQKLEVLRQIPPGILDKTNVLLVVMPERNPTLFFISQLKNASQTTSVKLNEFEVKGFANVGGDISSIEVEGALDATDYPQAISLLRYFENVAPLAKVNGVRISRSNSGTLDLGTSISIFFSNLPTQLPPLTSPIKALTSEQEDSLKKVANFFLPEFNVILPSEPTDRANPFR